VGLRRAGGSRGGGGPPPHRLRRGDHALGATKDIREAVKAELDFDPLVDAATITVKNTNGTSR